MIINVGEARFTRYSVCRRHHVYLGCARHGIGWGGCAQSYRVAARRLTRISTSAGVWVQRRLRLATVTPPCRRIRRPGRRRRLCCARWRAVWTTATSRTAARRRPSWRAPRALWRHRSSSAVVVVVVVVTSAAEAVADTATAVTTPCTGDGRATSTTRPMLYRVRNCARGFKPCSPRTTTVIVTVILFSILS